MNQKYPAQMKNSGMWNSKMKELRREWPSVCATTTKIMPSALAMVMRVSRLI